MLTEKAKSFIENVAVDMREQVEMKNLNEYNIKDIIEFVKSMGCHVVYGAGSHSYSSDTIYLAYAENFVESDNTNDVLKVLFHEIWHFVSDKVFPGVLDRITQSGYSEVSTNPQEASANYFMRAMLLPEEAFMHCVIDNIDLNGMCNVFAVANSLRVSYMDVIARGNDLSLWNKKGGI